MEAPMSGDANRLMRTRDGRVLYDGPPNERVLADLAGEPAS